MNEAELRELCARLLLGRADAEDGRALGLDEKLAGEVGRRLASCGVRLHLEEVPLAVVDDAAELSELAEAALAILVLALAEPSEGRARIEVAELTRRLGGGYSESYVRRAVLGPLQARALVKVVKPEQRAREAYVVAGPALAAIDPGEIRARLEAA
jgi:hypothetical protein